jgi:UDP-N-acetylmuramyl pentapeptide phosphotransferase/UDP-N-acetylglucosamine-1-phosphate transferase
MDSTQLRSSLSDDDISMFAFACSVNKLGPIRVTSTILALTAAASFLGSLHVCVLARDFALRRALLDRPNERSLHTTPVPRLGGVAIVLACYAALLLALRETSQPHALWPWLLGALPVAALGLLDDLRPLHAGLRLLIQLGVAGAFCATLALPTELLLTPALSVTMPAAVFGIVGAVFLVALLNIYNFMDGMDGLAATQAVGASMAFATSAIAFGHEDLALLSLALLGASGGFFVHNAPPAKLFMGDVGSTFLGFSFASITFIGLTRPTHPIALSPAIFALAPFLFDGCFTLLRRALRGEKIWQAHRTHLYQRAVASGLQHHDVLVRYAAWTAFGVVTAVADVHTKGGYTWLFALSHVACFVAVWRWVCTREAAHEAANQRAAEPPTTRSLRLEHR